MSLYFFAIMSWYNPNLMLRIHDFWLFTSENRCQQHSFFQQLTQNMTADCLLNYKFSTCCVHQIVSKKNNVHNMYRTRNSMNNLSLYCGLIDARMGLGTYISQSVICKKDPTFNVGWNWNEQKFHRKVQFFLSLWDEAYQIRRYLGNFPSTKELKEHVNKRSK